MTGPILPGGEAPGAANAQRKSNPMQMAVVGPTYPFRGGIAHYTTLMVRHLRERHNVQFYSFTSQYPRWLFPGKSDLDPSRAALREPCEYLLSPLNPLSWLRTAGRIRADEPDALIIPWWVPFWAPAWFVLTRLAQAGRSLRIIFVCHNVWPHERRWWDRPLARLALSSGSGFIVHSQQEADDLLSLLPRPEVRITPHPTYQAVGQTALDVATARRELNLEVDQRVLLFFGFVRPYKGLDVLLEALPAIRHECPVHLLIVGETWGGDARLATQMEQLKSSPDVTIVDQYVPNEDLGRYFGAADVVVLPYRSATQSGVVQLAFGFGKPVITTRVGGLAEVVSDGINGLIVPPDDPLALADAVVRFYHDDLGETLAAGVASQADRFSWQHLAGAIEELAGNQGGVFKTGKTDRASN